MLERNRCWLVAFASFGISSKLVWQDVYLGKLLEVSANNLSLLATGICSILGSEVAIFNIAVIIPVLECKGLSCGTCLPKTVMNNFLFKVGAAVFWFYKLASNIIFKFSYVLKTFLEREIILKIFPLLSIKWVSTHFTIFIEAANYGVQRVARNVEIYAKFPKDFNLNTAV